MPRARTLWDHYLEARALLIRADIHLEFLADDVTWLAKQAEVSTHRTELTTKLREELATHLKKKAPSSNA